MTHEAAPASPESLGVSQDELIPTPASKGADLDAEPSGLAGLLARVEAATGPDRELDRDIAVWEYPTLADLPRAYHGGWVHPEYGVIAPPSAYTASLDAALALCERALPGWRRSILEHGPQSWEAVLGLNYGGRADKGPHEVRTGASATAPLALLCAMLKALIAEAAGPATGSSHRLDEPLLSKGGGESSSREPSPSIRGVVRGGTEP